MWIIYFLSFLFSALVIVTIHESGHYLVARLCGVRVLQFSIGFGAPLLQKQWKGTHFVLASIPMGGFVRMLDEREGAVHDAQKHRAFNRKKPWQRMSICLAGPLANFVFAIAAYTGVMLWGDYPLAPWVNEPVVGQVLEGSPAEKAGFQSGDHIVSVADESILHWQSFVSVIASNPHQTLTVVVLREKTQKTLNVTVGENEHHRGFIGVIIQKNDMASSSERTLMHAVQAGFARTVHEISFTTRMLYHMAVGKASVQELSGPLGIAEGAGHMALMGGSAFIGFLALLSISLGVINCLPVPVLDGGQFCLHAWEMLAGRPVSLKIQLVLNKIGMVMLLSGMGVALCNDLARLFL